MHCSGYAWVCHLPNDLNSASVPSASSIITTFTYPLFIGSARHILYTISSLAAFFSHSASSSPAIPNKNNSNNNNRWIKFWASSVFIINAFAVFLTVKGEAPAPPLSHDHLPVRSLRGLHEGQKRAFAFFFFFRWHASTLTTFLATATAPATCPAPITMAARCSLHTLKNTGYMLTPTRGLHPGCTLLSHLLHCTTTMPYFPPHSPPITFIPVLKSRLLYLYALPTAEN